MTMFCPSIWFLINTFEFLDDFVAHNVSTVDTCALLALCRAKFEVIVTNVIDLEKSEDRISLIWGEDEPVVMAMKGGGGGRGGGRSSSRGRSSSSSSRSSSSFRKILLPGGQSTGSVHRVGLINRGGMGRSFIPIFTPVGGGRHTGHTCNLACDVVENREMTMGDYCVIGFFVVILISMIALCVRRSRRQKKLADRIYL